MAELRQILEEVCDEKENLMPRSKGVRMLLVLLLVVLLLWWSDGEWLKGSESCEAGDEPGIGPKKLLQLQGTCSGWSDDEGVDAEAVGLSALEVVDIEVEFLMAMPRSQCFLRKMGMSEKAQKRCVLILALGMVSHALRFDC